MEWTDDHNKRTLQCASKCGIVLASASGDVAGRKAPAGKGRLLYCNMETTEIRSLSEDFEKTRQQIEDLLKKCRSADTVVDETTLVFEALCYSIFAQQEDAVITVSGRERLGYATIQLSYEGRMYIPESDETAGLSPEGRVLRAYAEKIDCSYRFGYNRIRITVRRGSLSSMLPCIIGMLLAIAVYCPLHFLLDAAGKQFLLDKLVFPLEQLFTNAVLMVCAPVTFLSFLKNMTDTYILAVRNSDARKLHRAVGTSSFIAVLLAVISSIAVSRSALRFHLSSSIFASARMDISLPEWISSLIPADIFTPFQTISPFPLFIISGIVTYALCSIGKYFDSIKNTIDICYALFSRMLGIVMYALPFFVFAAFMDILLSAGFGALLSLACLTLAIFLSLLVLAAYYAIRLRRSKAPVLPFVKRLLPLLYENWKIGSTLDAVPFNIRYCMKHYQMDRRRLENTMPVLAQINLDGNCFVITLAALILMFTGHAELTPQGVAAVAMLVLFLSLGAPNQPGSCLIGMVILLSYMNCYDLLPLAIFCEMFFGGVLTLINTTGGIVTLVGLEEIPSTD